jgi:integrase
LKAKEASTKTKPQTVDRYRQLLERHALPVFGHRPVRAISVANVNDFITALSGDDRAAVTATDSNGTARARRRRLSPATVRHAVNPVRQVLALAVREGALRHNVAIDADLPTARSSFQPCFLSPDQVATLAATVHDQQSAATESSAPDAEVYALVVLTLAYTGLRAAELAGLTVSSIKPQSVEITRTLTKVRGGYRIGTPKNRKSRTVPIPEWLAMDLGEYIA